MRDAKCDANPARAHSSELVLFHSKEDLADLVDSETESILAVKKWLSSIGANMDTFVVHPIGDSAFVSWPPGVTSTKAPPIPLKLKNSHVDYTLLIKPNSNMNANATGHERFHEGKQLDIRCK